MNQRALLVGIVAVALAFAIMFLTAPGSDDPVPTGETARSRPVPSRTISRIQATKSEGQRPVRPAPTPSPAGVPRDVPAPVALPPGGGPRTDDEEGIFAYAEAAGLAVVRCPTDTRIPDEILGILSQSTMVGPELVLPVEPNPGPGEEKLKVFSAGGWSMFLQYSDAFPGEPGTCRMQLQERPVPVVGAPGGKLDPTDPSIREAIRANLEARKQANEDRKEVMDPFQVALERDDLSEGARAWLEAQLDAQEADDAATIEALDRLAIPEE